MWKVAQDRLRQLRYQRVATSSVDDGDEISYSSELTLPVVDDAEFIQSKRNLRTLVTFAFSSLCLFTSVSWFLYRLRHQVTDERCMRQMSAPSMASPLGHYELILTVCRSGFGCREV